MIEREINRLRTRASVRDGFGGDTYRRRFVGDVAQCGCRWARETGLGDVLKQCDFHQMHTEETTKREGSEGDG